MLEHSIAATVQNTKRFTGRPIHAKNSDCGGMPKQRSGNGNQPFVY